MSQAFYRAVGVAAVALLLSAFSWPTTLRVPDAPAASFTLVDSRSDKQLKSNFESLLVTNCAYGSFRMADADFSPRPAERLRAELASRLNPALAGRQLMLRNFTVHQNASAALRNFMSSNYGGLVDELANDHRVSGCAADDLRGGYTLAEVPPPTAAWVVVIDLDLDGASVHARAVSPVAMPAKFEGATRAERKAKQQQARSEDLNRALDSALDALTVQVAARLGVQAAPRPESPAASVTTAGPASAAP